MFKINIFITIVLFSFHVTAQDKIVGGEKVKEISEVPYIVKLKGGCAGSIVASQWILTAAHCEPIFNRGLSAGSLDANSNENRLELDDYFIHPQFNPKTLSYDFALIKLKKPVPLNNSNLKIVPMANYAHDSGGFQSPGTMATVYGWGATREDGRTTRFLRKVNVPIVSNQVANHPSSYDGKIDSSMIAAGFPKGGKDSCQGDSGGPMITKGQQGEAVLTGVVSWGKGCARRSLYGIYSRISEVQDWITNLLIDES